MILRKKSIIREGRGDKQAYGYSASGRDRIELSARICETWNLPLIMKGIFVAFGYVVTLAYAGEPPPCPADGPRECIEARAALLEAESAVAQATRLKALWTTAQNALSDAEAAFARTDYRSAVRAAAQAEELAKLGIAQTSYPVFPRPEP
jgi:hypothetical protein